MDESNSKKIMTHGNYWTYLIFMSNFISEKGVKGETQRATLQCNKVKQ
jgi:hypothetical protein